MARTIPKHGSESGYKAEQITGNICTRCRNAHRQWQKQYTKAGKAKGLKYRSFDVIDQFYNRPDHTPNATRPDQTQAVTGSADYSLTSERVPQTDQTGPDPETSAQSPAGPSLADRLKSAMTGKLGETYVETGEMPDYLKTVNPDPEPDGGEWSTPASPSDFVMTEQTLKIIEGNLATYLSVVGITVEMIDPYCGPILADNFDNMVNRWTRVIGRYPAAAKLFMSEGGGTIMAWIGAIQATWPVLYALYEHHFAKTVVTEKGKVKRVSKNGTPPGFDPEQFGTMPPQFEYTVGP